MVVVVVTVVVERLSEEGSGRLMLRVAPSLCTVHRRDRIRSNASIYAFGISLLLSVAEKRRQKRETERERERVCVCE
jgi:hypothetical protein